nr:uncharacterized protein LOC128671853 [Plodia interpunctella]
MFWRHTSIITLWLHQMIHSYKFPDPIKWNKCDMCVCGSDGNTYIDDWHLLIARLTNPYLTQSHFGPCWSPSQENQNHYIVERSYGIPEDAPLQILYTSSLEDLDLTTFVMKKTETDKKVNQLQQTIDENKSRMLKRLHKHRRKIRKPYMPAYYFKIPYNYYYYDS